MEAPSTSTRSLALATPWRSSPSGKPSTGPFGENSCGRALSVSSGPAGASGPPISPVGERLARHELPGLARLPELWNAIPVWSDASRRSSPAMRAVVRGRRRVLCQWLSDTAALPGLVSRH